MNAQQKVYWTCSECGDDWDTETEAEDCCQDFPNEDDDDPMED